MPRLTHIGDIPTTSQASTEVWPPSLLAKDVRQRVAREAVSRRGVLKGALIASALGSLKLVSWLGPGASQAFAYGSCTSEFLGAQDACNPPYPGGYSGGICFGSNHIGNEYCNNGNWHRRDTEDPSGPYRMDYKRACGAYEICGSSIYGYKNAWRWKKDGVVYRCSDGFMFIYQNGNLESRVLTICRGAV